MRKIYEFDNNNSKEKLLHSLEKDNEVLNSEYRKIVINYLKNKDLTTIDENLEYTFKLNLAQHNFELITQEPFWDASINCINYKNVNVIDCIEM